MRCAVLLISASCASVGDPPPLPPELVTIAPNGAGLEVVVDNPVLGFSMRFHDGAVKMPDQLSVGDVGNILGTDGCNTESQIGVAVHPAVVATANTEASMASSTITRLIEHPAIAAIAVDYNVHYNCPLDQALTGQAIFTIFASGRIVREDNEVQPTQVPLSAPNDPATQNCGCLSGPDPLDQQAAINQFFFTSYWAFAPVTPPAIEPDGDVNGGGLDAGCTLGQGYAVGVQWPEGSTNTRIGPNLTASHVFDFVNDSKTLATTAESVISRVQLSASPPDSPQPMFCRDLLNQVAPHDLDVDGVGLSTARNGIYRDDTVHSEPFDLTANDGSIPAGFAISLNLSGSQHARFIASGDGEFLAPIVKEDTFLNDGETPGDRFLIYFPSPLFATQRITIEPL